MDRAEQRSTEIKAAVADIRIIEQREGFTRESLERIKTRFREFR